MDWLRDELAVLFEREGDRLFKEPWQTRDGYISAITNRSGEHVEAFLRENQSHSLNNNEKVRALKLLELQRPPVGYRIFYWPRWNSRAGPRRAVGRALGRLRSRVAPTLSRWWAPFVGVHEVIVWPDGNGSGEVRDSVVPMPLDIDFAPHEGSALP
jgi:hypothetical protein